MEHVPKIKLERKGPASSFRNPDIVEKLKDDAQRKAILLDAVKKMLFDFFLRGGFSLEDIETFQLNLEKRLLKHSASNSPHELAELAAETLRDTMKRLRIVAPGFRDDFLQELHDALKVHSRNA